MFALVKGALQESGGEFSSGNYGSKCKNVSESKATGM